MRTVRFLVPALLLAASAASAQTPAVTLEEAVRTTIDKNATIAIETATTNLLVGQQQTTVGTFDALFSVAPSTGFTLQPVAPGLKATVKSTRDSLSQILNNFRALTSTLQASIRSSQIVQPRCPANLAFSFPGFSRSSPFLQQPITVDRIDLAEQTALGTKTFLAGSSIGDILGGITLSNICTNPAVIGLAPSNFFQAIRDIANSHAIDQSGGQGLNGFLTSVAQIPPESRLLELQIADAVATRARLALQRLGPLPIDDLQRTTALDLTLGKQLRNGLHFSGGITLQSQDHRFRDRSYDPAFGGLGQPPNFASAVQGTLNIPMGRGLGYTAVGAAERSAGFQLAAQRENVRHSATEQAFRTSLAYLNAIAARDSIAALETSLGRQRRIVQLTEQGAESGDLPRVEVDRARARAARVESQISGARSALTTARLSLAEVMGLDPDRIEAAPMPTETLSRAIAALPAVDDLVTRALALRRDVQVRKQRELSAQTLAEGAQSDLKRRYDFNINAGLVNIYDSPIFRFLPDEQGTIIPAPAEAVERAVTYYSPVGYSRALAGRYEPFAVATLTLDLPFGNNAARGRLHQAEATLQSSRIDAFDLSRTIRENVVDVAGQLRRAAASIANLEAAVRADEEMLQSMIQRFEIRDVTLIDTIVTEESATNDMLRLISQRQAYLSTLARLKFETGELLTFDTDGASIRTYKFDPSFLVAR